MPRADARRWAVVLSSDAIGLGAVRSLHAGSIPIVVATLNRWEPVAFSRFATKRHIPASDDVELAVMRTLRAIVRDRHHVPLAHRPVLLPTSDFFADLVGRHRDELDESYRLAVPSAAAMEDALDKARAPGWLAEARVPAPATAPVLPSAPDALIRHLGLPLLIKPRTYVDKRELGWRNVVVQEPAHLERFYLNQRAAFKRVVAQELIPGDDDTLWECIGVFDESSELVSAFTFRKLRTMPAHYGQTSWGRSEYNERVIELARRIGKHLGYTGPADIDFKYDARDDSYKVLELNPRLGMCHHFATRCGVNLALDAWRVAGGEPVAPGRRQKDGVTFFAALEDTGGRLHDGESPLQVLWGLLQALAGAPVGAYFAWNDPLPGPLSTLRLALRLAAKAWRGQLAAVFTKDYGKRSKTLAAR